MRRGATRDNFLSYRAANAARIARSVAPSAFMARACAITAWSTSSGTRPPSSPTPEPEWYDAAEVAVLLSLVPRHPGHWFADEGHLVRDDVKLNNLR